MINKLDYDVVAIKIRGDRVLQSLPIRTKQEMIGHYKNGYVIYKPSEHQILVASHIDVAYGWVDVDIITKLKGTKYAKN